MEAIIPGLSLSGKEWLSLCIDLSLLIGIFMLWLTWYRNGKRQQAMEHLLATTAAQLDEATRHLAEATHSMQQLKSRQEQSQEPRRPVEKQAAAQHAHSRTDSPRPAFNNAPPPQNSTQATMILRMHREGDRPETIADRLDMPLAQVKLMLKLHASSPTTAAR